MEANDGAGNQTYRSVLWFFREQARSYRGRQVIWEWK